MDKNEIIKKIEETGIKPSVIITKEGKCIIAFPECYINPMAKGYFM